MSRVISYVIVILLNNLCEGILGKLIESKTWDFLLAILSWPWIGPWSSTSFEGQLRNFELKPQVLTPGVIRTENSTFSYHKCTTEKVAWSEKIKVPKLSNFFLIIRRRVYIWYWLLGCLISINGNSSKFNWVEIILVILDRLKQSRSLKAN